MCQDNCCYRQRTIGDFGYKTNLNSLLFYNLFCFDCNWQCLFFDLSFVRVMYSFHSTSAKLGLLCLATSNFC